MCRTEDYKTRPKNVNYKEPHIKLLFAFTKVLVKNKNLQSRC